MSRREISLVVGTAGHIDHGKTQLVKALTGIDCDRLGEEKKRGITIELGFAPLVLPSERVISLIDVPVMTVSSGRWCRELPASTRSCWSSLRTKA